MQECRYWAKSIVMQDHIWVTGGSDRYGFIIKFQYQICIRIERNDTIFYSSNGRLKSTELISIKNPAETTPSHDLPEPMFNHALININDTTSFLIGGNTDTDLNSPKTYFFNHITQTWINGPDLNLGRYAHTAGILIDHDSLVQHITVVGGSRLFRYHNFYTDSVEILFHGKNGWEEGILSHF